MFPGEMRSVSLEKYLELGIARRVCQKNVKNV
jgi:hypothetical protein